MKITICGGIIELTKFKQRVLDFEYNGFQKWMMFGIDEGIYSSYKNAKGWKFKEIKYKNYPLPLWGQLIKVDIQPNNKISKYWLKFRTKLKYGGIWIPFQTKQKIPNGKLCDSWLIRNNKGNYELRLLYEIKDISIENNINKIAVDFGEKRIATIVSSVDKKPIFLGKEVRGIRRHYSHLRKVYGRIKRIDKIKQVGSKEKRIVNNILHRISKSIILKAVQDNASIIIGDLRGIRNNAKGKGHRFNRIVGNMPYYKLTNMIIYKAQIRGIQVIKVNERNTSRLCHRCNSIGIRNKQSVFKCHNCNTSFDADWNGCLNILKRSEELVSSDGAMAFSSNAVPNKTVNTLNL